LSLTKITDDGWRATFHSSPALSADGFATDDKPWRAVQVAAWHALACIILGGEPRLKERRAKPATSGPTTSPSLLLPPDRGIECGGSLKPEATGASVLNGRQYG